jgi:hypothetical protein
MPVAAGNRRLNLDELIQERLLNDPFRQQAGDWFSKVLAPGYQAYTPEQMKQMYQARAQQMVEDVFKPQEEIDECEAEIQTILAELEVLYNA